MVPRWEDIFARSAAAALPPPVDERDAAHTVRSLDVDFLFAQRKCRSAARLPWGIHGAGANCRRGGTFDTIRKTVRWDRRV